MSNDTLLLNADGSPLSIAPLSTLSWQESIKLIFLDRVNVLEWHPDWIVHSQSMSMHVPSVISVREYISKSKTGVNFSRSNVFSRDKFMCQYCGNIHHPRDLTLDHILPRSKGGKTTWENIVTACKPCNHGKGDNEKIRPKRLPDKPNFYQLLNNKNFTIHIQYPQWLSYLNWPEEYVRLVA